MFSWIKNLFGKEEQKQVVKNGWAGIQAADGITISVPGSIRFSANTVETPAPSPTAPPPSPTAPPTDYTSRAAPVRRNPAPHASVASSPARTTRANLTTNDYRRRDSYEDTGPSITDYVVMNAVVNSSYSSPSSSDSCGSSSPSSSYDSGSSSSDSGSCGGD